MGTYRAVGEIDYATAPEFDLGLRAMIDRSDKTLVTVDCSDVTFMDSAGYHVLADAAAYAVEHGHTLMLRSLSPSCARLIRLCDGDGSLRVDLGG